MTEIVANLRLGIKCRGLKVIFFFLRFFVESKGKAILGAGMRHSFCRGLIGAR